jgi:SAM-dependent methyltransferase
LAPDKFYDEAYWRSPTVGKGYADYFSLAGALEHNHRRRLRWLRARLAASNSTSTTLDVRRPRLLDVGCGPGFFVRAASIAGFAAAGVEISEYAVTFARERLGQNVSVGEARAGDLRDGPFDVVTMWDVIEHLPDPFAACEAVGDVLKPSGLLAISTGDIDSIAARLSGARWHLFNLPEHLWFFTADSLKRLLRRAGLAPFEQRREVCWYTLRYLVERLEAMFGGRRFVSRSLGPVGRLNMPVTLRDIVTVLARKPGGAPPSGAGAP